MNSTTEMIPPQSARAALEGLRVLEVAGALGAYAGRLFAGLGADVVLVEPPGGAEMRAQPPYADDTPGTERSLWFAYTHAGKRGITLDLGTADGQTLFRRLASTADVVIESERPGLMKGRGLGYDDLSAVRPGLVYTSITPFGQEGPYSAYEATDLVLMAMGGLLCLGGYTDTEPMRPHGEQAVLAASQFAAVATMLALLSAEASGRGRHVDVSAQECVAMALENAAQFYDLEGRVRRRTSGQKIAGSGVYPCKDGYVYLLVRGLGVTKFWRPAVEWFKEEGAAGAEQLLEPRWDTIEWLEQEEAKEIFSRVFGSFAVNRTKAELYRTAQEKRLPLCPVSTPADLLESEQLRYRGFFASVPDGRLGRNLVMPGAPFQLSETPWRLQRAAPSLGEHNLQLYGELGLSAGDLVYLKAAGVI